ncbi:MAG: metalloregulator ArsR/SmtB family transcription factor [bacterium]|nr:metalloregulator ArsR/SmtB family transcription factor [bacterium]
MASIKRVGFSPTQNTYADLLKALGHPARIAILQLLTKNQLPCKHVEIELQISKSTLSRHMQILYDVGLIGYNKILNETYYSVNESAICSVSNFLIDSITSDVHTKLDDVHFKIPQGVRNPKL